MYQPSIGGHVTPVGEVSVEAFMIKHRTNLRTNCLEPREQCDRRWPPVHIRLDGYIAFSLDIGDLLQQQFDAGEFAQQRRPQSTRQRPPVACHQPVKPGSPIFAQWIITDDSLASEQPFDAIDVLNSLSQQVGAFT
jgi:hypothetical protein